MDLRFERRYPHPIQRVWEAITTSKGLEGWLMRNDFVAEVGRSSTFRFCEPDSDEDSIVTVTVETLEPPRRMVWRWRHEDEEEASETIVTFELEEIEGGTLLRVRHEGELPPLRADALREGWPGKLESLEALLSSSDR